MVTGGWWGRERERWKGWREERERRKGQREERERWKGRREERERWKRERNEHAVVVSHSVSGCSYHVLGELFTLLQAVL